MKTICNDTQASGHASYTVNHTVSTTQCQQAHAHTHTQTLSLHIPVSGTMTQISLCGLDMLAGKTRELPSAFSTQPEITGSTEFEIVHFYTQHYCSI